MTRELEGKIAVITGASTGIGAATALRMAGAGAKVVLAARREAECQAIVEGVQANKGEAMFVRTDVTQEDDVRNLIATTVERFGRIDCAFNNAGDPGRDPLPWHEKDVSVYDNTEAVNLRGVWLCMKYQLAEMVKQRSGVIVNNSSIAGITAGLGEVYSATKHGVVGLSRTAALNYGEYGIRVNVVCPGPIETPMIAEIPDELKQKAFKRIPLGRLGVPDEIAEPVVFLCSNRASYITGAVITIDGGVTESTMKIVDD